MPTPESRESVYETGDPVQPIRLPDATGDTVRLDDQRTAGFTHLLWFGPSDREAALSATLDDLQRDLDDVEALVAAIIDAEPDGAHGAGHMRLFDPGGGESRKFGSDNGGIAVIAPNGRLAATFSGDEAAAALETCRNIHTDDASAVIGTQAPILIVPAVLEPELCDALIAYWTDEDDKMENTVSSDDGASKGNDRFKIRRDAVLLDEALFTRVKDRLLKRVFPELFKAMQFKTANMEALRIGCYDGAAGGTFRRHRDNTTPYTANRKFAMSLNLSSDYAGGELLFPEYGRTSYRAPAGAAVLFSCSLLHEALPVTAGKRFAMFSFFTDAEGEERNREMKRRHGLQEFRMKP